MAHSHVSRSGALAHLSRDSQSTTQQCSYPPTDQFVERRGSDLYLAGQKFRFASLNAPELLDGDVNGPFEVRDTFAALAAEGAFGTAVTRTYTLRVRRAEPLTSACGELGFAPG